MSDITIIVDGLAERVAQGAGLPELIDSHQAAHKDLVVEINGRFVHRSRYAEIVLSDGDRVELIHPAFGG